MTHRQRPLALAALLLLFHCGTHVQVNSLPQGSGGKKIDRVFILCSSAQLGSGYLMNSLQANLSSSLEANHVASKAWISNILDVSEPEKLKAEIAAFKPHFILRISETSRTYTNGTASQGTFDLVLTGLEGDPVWKARAIGGGYIGDVSRQLSNRLVDAMRQDGILP